MTPEQSVVLVFSSLFAFVAMFLVESRNARALLPPIAGIQLPAFAVPVAGPCELAQFDLLPTNKPRLWLVRAGLPAIIHCFTRQSVVVNNVR